MATPRGERRWQPLGRPEGFANLPVGRLVDTRYGANYSLAQVHSDTAGRVVLEIGCAASHRLWWNGVVVAEQDRNRGDEALVERVEVPLRAGWNRILLKMAGEGAHRFSFRVHGEGGRAPSGLVFESAAVLHPLAPAPAAQAPAAQVPPARPFRDALGLLDGLEGAAADDPFVLAGRAWLTVARGEVTASLDLFRRASEGAPDSPNLAVYLGAAYARSRHLPEATRKNLARQAYQRALDLDPDCVPAILWFAADRRDEGHTREAYRLLERAAGLAPWSPGIDLMLADLCRVRGWKRERDEFVERAAEVAPDDPRVLGEVADLELDEGRPRKGAEALEASLAADREQPEVRRKLAALDRRLGRVGAARAILEEDAREHPASVGARLRLARFLGEEGEVEGAVSLLEEGVRLFPSSPRFPKELGDLHASRGHREEAARWYRRVLDMRPGEHEVRDALALLEGRSPEPYFDEFRIDSEPLIAGGKAYDEKYPRAESIALLDDLILRFYPDGSARMVTHQIFRILTEEGVQEHGTFRPDGTLLALRTVRPDGRILEPITLGRGEEYTLPGLESGASAEWRTETWIPNPAGMPLRMPTFYFQDVDSKSPFVRSRYVVIQPRDLRMRHVVRNDPWRPVTFERGDDIVTVYDVKDLGQLKPEPFMPAPLENVPQVTLVEPETWEELNWIFRKESKVAVSPEVRRRVGEWIEGVEGQAGRARVLYEKVNDWVRSPRGGGTPTETLLLRAGNRVRFYMACLEAAGIPYDYARARRSPEVDLEDPRWDWLREGLFPNPLLRVRPDDGPAVWVVMAAREQPYGAIPAPLYGSPVFLVDEGEGTIDYLPVAPIDEEIRLSAEVDLTPVGFGFEAKLRLVVPVSISGFWKERLRALTDAQKESMGLGVARSFLPGTRLEGVRFEGVETRGAPVTIEARVTSQGSRLQSGRNLMALRLGFPPLNLVGRYATAGQRTHPFLLEGYDYRTDVLRLHLGGDYRAVTYPRDLEAAAFLGPYRLRVRRTPDGLEIRREVSFHPARIPAAKYPDFMDFCRKIDDREAERIWLLPMFEGAEKKLEEAPAGAGGGEGSEGKGG